MKMQGPKMWRISEHHIRPSMTLKRSIKFYTSLAAFKCIYMFVFEMCDTTKYLYNNSLQWFVGHDACIETSVWGQACE